MASQTVMSTPIFDELLREMRAGAVEVATDRGSEDTTSTPATAAAAPPAAGPPPAPAPAHAAPATAQAPEAAPTSGRRRKPE
ncbi:hypothetical protein [Actinokineospora bangkokensis]|uniref:Uncharacterized protein n=1 Tax=Actinokineospora bangkokensis TaxID=1193682 RepID=A0A1Q9LR88_9PSEU|nr:hypothetical protein [Actinokineospora bangkokensis]OLR94523.1 hypothetical protein BJP25_12330 [Actinokineospora bangkokensis]